MATIPDSVKAQLDADWTGAGGAEPVYYVEEDVRVNAPTGEDYILILSSTLDTNPKPFNDKFTNEAHVLNILVNTLTSEDRLKEISDEVVRILNATAITDITYQRLKRRQIVSGIESGIFNYQEMITYDLQQQMKSSTAAYGAGTGPALTQAQLEALIMYGSTNAAYTQMIYNGSNVSNRWTNSLGIFINLGASDVSLDFGLPLQCSKGTLKLYLKNLKYGIQDADADDFTNTVYIYGHNGNTSTQLDIDNTNTIAAADVTFSGATMPAAAIDVSSYQSVTVYFVCSNTDANDLDIANVRMECYYDT